jgi:hypothetical protein
MPTFALDWSETNLGGSAVVSYARGAVLDFVDKPAGATAALSCTRGLSSGANNIAVLEVETTGSSVLTFDYKVSTEPGWDKLHIDVDGVSQGEWSGVVAWTSHPGVSIPAAGVHTIRFRYQKDPGGVNADRVWIANLNITNTVAANDDASTVDTATLEDGAIPAFVTTSTWTNSTSEPITGTRSLRSPTSTAGNGSYGLTVSKAATTDYRAVGFDWKVSSESGWDKLFIYPDSTAASVPVHPTAPAEGSPGWLDFSGTASGRLAVILPPAASSLLLRYAKDGSGNVGSDAAWIDNIATPAAGGGGTDYPRATADTASPADAVTRARTGPRTTADVAQPADTLGRASTRPRATSDTATATDATSGVRTGAPRLRSLGETLTISDTSAASSGGTASRTQADTATPADTTSRRVARPRGQADTATPTDTTTRTQSSSRGLSEISTAADLTAGVRQLARAALDAVTLGDTSATAPGMPVIHVRFLRAVGRQRDVTVTGRRLAVEIRGRTRTDTTAGRPTT